MAAGVAFLFISTVCMSLFLVYLTNAGSSQRPIRVACVGDSITEFSGYPDDLQSLLGENYTVGNFGVSGSTVTAESSKPYMNQSAFWNAQYFQPDVVVIMLGTNDASPENYRHIEEFSKTYEKLVNQFETLPGEQDIYLVNPPPIRQNELNLSDTFLTDAIIPRIEQIATGLNLQTVDVHSSLTNYPQSQ